MRRLLLELINRAVRVAVHDAEALGLLQRDVENRDGSRRVLFLVLVEHLVVVHLVDVVAREDQDVLRIVLVDKADVLIDGVCSALIPLRALSALVRRQSIDAAVQTVEIPCLTVCQIYIEDMRLILCQDTDGINTGVDTVGQRKVDNTVFAAKRHRRLCYVLGEYIQSAATAAGQQHCYAFFLPRHSFCSHLC